MFGPLISLGGFVLRKSRNRLDGHAQYGRLGQSGTITAASATRGPSLVTIGLYLLLAVFAVLAVTAFGVPHLSAQSALLLGATAVAPNGRKSGTEPKKPAKIREMEANLKAIAKELEQGQIEMAEGPITPERGEELEAKAQEMEELQEHINRYNKIAGINNRNREVERVTLPGDTENIRTKSLYTTPGHRFALSDTLRQWKQNGKQGWSGKVEVGNRLGKKIRLVGEEALAFEKKAFDSATLSDLGTDAIIEIDRDRELIRFEEPEILTMRDVMTVTSTSSDSIRYVRHIATDRAAKSVARADPKPYLRVEFQATNTSVKTVAVLSKVTEQDIDDAPRLVGFINGEMNLDVRVEEERQLAWGDGSNDTLVGLFDSTIGVPEFDRAEAGDTLIDTIRRMRTDLRKKRVQPNFVSVDPIDWEQIELEKGGDERYIWGLIQTLRGPEIWSLRVIESDAMTNLETGERRLLMGDGIRGATIYDRTGGIQLAVGLVDDDFARNLRTLRAEERLALAVKRAFAFEYTTTEEAAS